MRANCIFELTGGGLPARFATKPDIRERGRGRDLFKDESRISLGYDRAIAIGDVNSAGVFEGEQALSSNEGRGFKVKSNRLT